MTDLQPCPFCGSPAQLEEDSDHHGEWFNLGCSRHWDNPAVKEADKCCGGRIWYTADPSEQAEAIKQWNTRYAPMENAGVAATVDYLLRQMKQVNGPCQTIMWESPDGQGGQFSDKAVALRCWMDRALAAFNPTRES